ncbi:hypothetical protein MPY17_19420 [Rhodococcus opacus]|uniref:hypothetical protein n=1 Tax=Rhodococcus opacus TaxID=37919 RepID=UPI001FF180FE|nr:hypothetical protein [Rhodococcus opacus]UOT01213.1 hypothetical protein MPY17_19420 [Rhodococcus opacus]
MRRQIGRGVLAPLGAMPPGSPWWRAVNERLIRDGCEAVARSGGMGGTPSSRTVDLWMLFVGDPTARTWYRAHNASIASEWSVDELDDPGLLDCICDGSPTCAWSYSDREVWHPASPAVTIRAVRRILPAN